MRRISLVCFTLVIAIMFLSGCATVMTGSNQKVPVTSNPSGAIAKVDGTMASATPTTFTLERRTDHTIEISKEGYKTSQIILRHTLSGATAGNLLIGGIVGIAIDGCSGAMFKLLPERVDVTLEKADGTSPAPVTQAQAPVVTETKPVEQLQNVTSSAAITDKKEALSSGNNFANIK